MDKREFEILGKASKDVRELLLQEANKKISSVNATADVLNKKSFILITILISILGIVVSFGTKDMGNILDANKTFYMLTYGILIIGFFSSFILLMISIYTRKYYGLSFKPSEILHASSDHGTTKDNIQNILINWYDIAIIENCKKNNDIGKCINWAVFISFLSLSLFTACNVCLKVL